MSGGTHAAALRTLTVPAGGVGAVAGGLSEGAGTRSMSDGMEGWLLLAAALVLTLAFLLLRSRRTVEQVQPWETGLLYGPRGFIRILPPGRHGRFDPLHRTVLYHVATHPQALPGAPIEAISADRFAFRVTFTVFATITDPRAAVEGGAAGPLGPGQLHPALSAAALAALARRALDSILDDPAAVVAEIEPQLADVVPGYRVDRLVLTAILLPPEVRKMFTEVERARREGLAALERARGEQAALRALANAARNLDGNPALAQLRMLQVMETAKGAKTFVLGSADPSAPAAG